MEKYGREVVKKTGCGRAMEQWMTLFANSKIVWQQPLHGIAPLLGRVLELGSLSV